MANSPPDVARAFVVSIISFNRFVLVAVAFDDLCPSFSSSLTFSTLFRTKGGFITDDALAEVSVGLYDLAIVYLRCPSHILAPMP